MMQFELKCLKKHAKSYLKTTTRHKSFLSPFFISSKTHPTLYFCFHQTISHLFLFLFFPHMSCHATTYTFPKVNFHKFYIRVSFHINITLQKHINSVYYNSYLNFNSAFCKLVAPFVSQKDKAHQDTIPNIYYM